MDHYELSVCAIFQNEAPYLKEWIEHHEKHGVQHFWLYNNNSIDDYKEILQPHINKGIVELIEWPGETQDKKNWNSLQCNAYMDCVKRSKEITKWCAFIDIDEFLFCPTEIPLTEALLSYEEFGGVCVNWVMYGTSNVEKILPHEKLVDKLLYRLNLDSLYTTDLDAPFCTYVKTIAQPSRICGCTDPHFFFYKRLLDAVTENKQYVNGSLSTFNSVKTFRINHYWSKDKNFFYNHKIPREFKWGRSIVDMIAMDKTFNEVYDPILSRINNTPP